MSKTEYLSVVDENDRVVSKASWREIREKNLPHRASLIFLFNSKKEILVTQRSRHFKFYPLAYCVAVGGGVSYGQSYEEAAIRELYEETGINGAKINFLFKYHYVSKDNNVFLKIYSCRWDGDIRLQEDEIESGFFASVDRIKEMMKKENFLPSNKEIFEIYLREHYQNDPAIKDI